jgi:serine/threonine protein kinase
VWLCREIKGGKIVALKKLKKAEMVRRGQIDHVKAERDVLVGIHNPFIVRLYYSFQVSVSCTRNVFYFFIESASWPSRIELMLHICDPSLS